MAVKVSFEIGHMAKLKSKKTPEGFTHDWELYVKGVDKSDISHFIDKVVFNLHDSFPKPKRTYKEAPYVLKESGYAGFVLPIDIYFKNRDEPKKVTYSYDLDLQTTGPPVHRSIVKKCIFNNPSEEFKQKLLKGGGSLLMMNYDEKSRDSTDERAQVAKPKSSGDAVKKHKIRPEDSKMQTFATLFGPPITKTSTKVSPDPKSKGSPSLTPINKGNTKAGEKSSASSLSGKEKSEKNEKKEKHRRSSPHKERDSSKDSRKVLNEEKHERKEEKSKEKSHSKDRDRSKDRALKRPASPKRASSPKRPSPPRSSSTTSRGEDSGPKQQLKAETDSKKGSSNSGRKSKKEKKSHEKDKDRERKERDRERKEKDERSNNTNPPLPPAPSNVNHPSSAQLKGSAETKLDAPKKESGQTKEVKEMKKVEAKTSENTSLDKKIVEKHDKDSEKKHKHKKKDKSKDKEKEKDVSSKEKKKEKSSKQKDDIKKVPQPTPHLTEPILPTQQKSTPNSVNNPPSKLSDHESSDSENETPAPPAIIEPKSNNNHSDTSNSSFPDLPISKPPIPQFEESKLEKKEHKSREKTKLEKDSKKRKRKSKDDPDSFVRKSVSPVVTSQPEPPSKQSKKDELKTDEKPNSPASSGIISNQPTPQDASPRISNSSPVFRTPTSAPIPMALSANNSSERNPINVDYMSELRELQHKIMTLQDNNELQQVVEMIAATGRFEVTSKTFDFDLCALDRTTVQRLQDFLATSVS